MNSKIYEICKWYDLDDYAEDTVEDTILTIEEQYINEVCNDTMYGEECYIRAEWCINKLKNI